MGGWRVSIIPLRGKSIGQLIMTTLRFVIRSFVHYLRYNLTVTAGVAISTAVLTGALIIGDSVRHSLEKTAFYRLGKTSYALTAGDRYFTTGFADKLQYDLNIPCIPLLLTEGVAVQEGGGNRINNIKVIGVDDRFSLLLDDHFNYGDLGKDEVYISENLAAKFDLNENDPFLLRIRKTSLLPLNAPFVSDEETSISLRVKVGNIVGVEKLGQFNLQNSQTAPFNVFINLDFLNRLMETEGKSNTILFASAGTVHKEEIARSIRKNWDLKDASLKIRTISKTDELEVFSERVFIEPAVIDAFNNGPTNKRLILTYFVNTFRKGNKETPYSFVSTLDGKILKADEIIVSKWLADDMSLQTGDTVELKYFVVGPLRQFDEKSSFFRVKEIVPLSDKYQDPTLMPFIPGLLDAGSCREWKAGIPIDLSKIRDKDEEYWNKWKGTPKAFINIGTALNLWQNRFGDYTSIRFAASEINEEKIKDIFRKYLDPADLGFNVRNVKEEALYAARNGVNFSQLFIGLSFFVLISAVLLTSLLFLLNLAKRSTQAGTLSALGYSYRLIRKLFLMEGIIIAILGALLGLILAIVYNKIILLLLNSLWSDIVRTSILEMEINPITLITGFVISIAIAILTIIISLRRLKGQTVEIQKGIKEKEKKRTGSFMTFLAVITGMAGLAVIFIQLVKNELNTAMFFTAGSLFLISLLLISGRILKYSEKRLLSFTNISHLTFRNISRSRQRSYAIIILFALGTFIIVATGSNRKDITSGAGEITSGTGGYNFFAESTVPVLHDLNNKKICREYGMEGDYSFVQFSKSDGDDASCLNLNRINNPVILGVDPIQLSGRFTFVTSITDMNETDLWSSLSKDLMGGLVPAIADQTVIQWGLGKKVGDTLLYKNASGDTLMLKLIGGLAPSIFQGNVIISDRHFLENFPASSGSSVFLIEIKAGSDTLAEEDISRAMRDWGWQMTTTTERLAEFNSVQNTYLSIFLMLGVLSLVIGTVGLGILIARSIMERKSEIGLLLALGYKQNTIYRIIFTEYFILIIAGIMIGFVPAIISTLPSLLSLNTDVSVTNLIYILLFLVLNSIFWIGLFTRINIREDLVMELKAE
jgi:ABC-type antimicrobial peptide transport system permease subunit